MKKTDELDEIFAELRREHRRTGPPEALEANLVRLIGDERYPKKRKASVVWMWWMGGAVAATILLGIVVWTMHRRFPQPAVAQMQSHSSVEVSSARSGPGQAEQHNAKQIALSVKAHGSRQHGARKEAKTEPEKESGELFSRFIALPGSEGLPPPSEASIVRVQMTKGDLQRYGFEVPPAVVAELIHADFFLGEDGVPRAVRLVR